MKKLVKRTVGEERLYEGDDIVRGLEVERREDGLLNVEKMYRNSNDELVIECYEKVSELEFEKLIENMGFDDEFFVETSRKLARTTFGAVKKLINGGVDRLFNMIASGKIASIEEYHTEYKEITGEDLWDE